MRYKVDFAVSNSYGVVENAIFRLACNGVVDIDLIKALLNIFSEKVLAIAVRRLVNDQILFADTDNGYLQIPDVLKDLIDACQNKAIEFDLPPAVVELNVDGTIQFPCYLDYNARGARAALIDVKTGILHELLPGINASYYAGVLDLFLTEVNPE